MVNIINIHARLEAISEIANLVSADFKLRDGKIIEWSKGNPPTEEEIQSKIDSKQYQSDRATSYPSIQEQLDLLYHDMTNDKGNKSGEWYKTVNKVKTDNPKPS